MGRAFRQTERFIVDAAGTSTFTLTHLPLALTGLTVWAVSGGRAITDLTFQPQVNGVDLGGSTNVAAAVAATVVYAGGVDENILPVNADNGKGELDPFVFSVTITDAGSGIPATRTVTIYAVGLAGDH